MIHLMFNLRVDVKSAAFDVTDKPRCSMSPTHIDWMPPRGRMQPNARGSERSSLSRSLAALHSLESLPYVDQNRLVVMRASFGGIRTSCPSNAEPVIALALIVRVGLRSGADVPTQPRPSRSGLHHRPLRRNASWD